MLMGLLENGLEPSSNKVEAFIGMLLLLLDGHLLYKPFPYTDKDLVLFS